MIFLISIGFLEFSFNDALDILLVAVLLYQVYKLMRGSVAINIFFGILSIYLLYLLVRAAEMELLSIILGQFIGVGVLAAIILFQQEIRKFLLMVGKTTIYNNARLQNYFPWSRSLRQDDTDVEPAIDAAMMLSEEKTGVLIVFPKFSDLPMYADTGDRIEAKLSKRLLISIFNKYSPLHDGAVIISNDKILAARCIIPVTERQNIPASYGLRHRAAIGMSEATDSIVLVVSEETGKISLALNGTLKTNLSESDMRRYLNMYLSTADNHAIENEFSGGVSAS